MQFLTKSNHDILSVFIDAAVFLPLLFMCMAAVLARMHTHTHTHTITGNPSYQRRLMQQQMMEGGEGGGEGGAEGGAGRQLNLQPMVDQLSQSLQTLINE